ncbi:Vacuolar membrane amino acid uptake transporter fnx2 [Mycena chlorophos]|uniref:Vacuolar membrane amino acid uptake transporter fnx2 n=1 Tax=Mycena chlorophos TaxID=658473 RepID=A0A8H6TPY3_MYCCL|nr:Vacuolar membrane amino acid uptake transporter fnx2 [Mycena chlorophos]
MVQLTPRQLLPWRLWKLSRRLERGCWLWCVFLVSLDEKRADDGNGQLLPMAIGIFFTAMDQTIVVSSYASIGNEMNQLQLTSWIATAYMLTLTSFQPLYGKMSDIFGRKACLLFAYTVFALGTLGCGLSRTMPELILARALTGIGGGGMSTVVSIIMSDIVPLRSRGTWQGVLNVIYASGSATGAPLGGFLSDSIGWRWGFLVQVPAIAVAFVAVSFALHLPSTPGSTASAPMRTKLARVDFSGALSLVLTVFFLLFGLDRGGNLAWSNALTITALSLSLAFFVAFSLVELYYAAEPFAPRRIIANPSLIYAYLVNLFGLASGFSMIFHLALFYQAVLRKSPAEVGWWLVPSVFAGVIGSLGGGLWIQATGKYKAVTVCAYIAMVVGTFWTTLSAGEGEKGGMRTAVMVAVGAFLVAVGNGTGITTSLIALISNAGAADQAIATAVSYLFRSLGSVVGLSVASTLLQVTLRRKLHETLGADGDVDVDEITRQVRASLAYIDTLSPHVAALVREAYERAVLNAMWFSTAMSVCALGSAMGIREKKIGKGSVREQDREADGPGEQSGDGEQGS